MLSFLISAALAGTAWLAPLPTPLAVERPFQAPSAPWGPGHRGVDLSAANGTPVRSAGAGRVLAAGRIAGRYVVSIEHPGAIALGVTGWRTTYEGVRPRVRVGEAVLPGSVIGVLDSAGGHCSCLHWGLRRGTSYADPLILLSRPIVLKPLRRPSPPP